MSKKLVLSNHSTFLFAEPNYGSGFAAIVGDSVIVGHYNISQTEREADCKALRHDWMAIGQDLYTAAHDEIGPNEFPTP